MRQVLRYGVVVAAVALIAPETAGAQVYPDRIVVKARAVAAGYQRRVREGDREEQTERTTKTVRLGSDGSLDLGNMSGDITVTRGGGSDATIEVVKTGRGRTSSDAKAQLDLVTVDITERAGRVEVKTRYPNLMHGNVNVSVAYNVTAPSGTRVTANSMSGSIRITDIKGDVSANTMSGDVRIRRVTARRVSGGSISGEVRFEEIDSDTVGAHTISGEITFAGALARHGRYEFKTNSGDVRMTLSGNTGFEVDGNSFSGGFRSDFPLTTHGTDAPGRRGPRRNHVQGTFGDGSAIVDITTFSGSIVIAKR